MNTNSLLWRTLARCMHSDSSGTWERHKAVIRFWSSQPIPFRWQLLLTSQGHSGISTHFSTHLWLLVHFTAITGWLLHFIGEWPAELLLVRELGIFQVRIPTTGVEVRAQSIAFHGFNNSISMLEALYKFKWRSAGPRLAVAIEIGLDTSQISRKKQPFYLRPDLPHYWLFPLHS